MLQNYVILTNNVKVRNNVQSKKILFAETCTHILSDIGVSFLIGILAFYCYNVTLIEIIEIFILGQIANFFKTYLTRWFFNFFFKKLLLIETLVQVFGDICINIGLGLIAFHFYGIMLPAIASLLILSLVINFFKTYLIRWIFNEAW